MRTAKVTMPSTKLSTPKKKKELENPAVLITRTEKEGKIKSALITFNKAAITLLNLEPKKDVKPIIRKQTSITDLNEEGLAVYNSTFLSETDVPMDGRSSLSAKNSTRLLLEDYTKIYKKSKVVTGVDYWFILDEIQIEFPSGNKHLAYTFEKLMPYEKPEVKEKTAEQIKKSDDLKAKLKKEHLDFASSFADSKVIIEKDETYMSQFQKWKKQN
jgi:hypothetical protein